MSDMSMWWLVVFPSLNDYFVQSRIVAHLDALQEKVNAIKKPQADTAAELALLQSILDKAFTGEL